MPDEVGSMSVSYTIVVNQALKALNSLKAGITDVIKKTREWNESGDNQESKLKSIGKAWALVGAVSTAALYGIMKSSSYAAIYTRQFGAQVQRVSNLLMEKTGLTAAIEGALEVFDRFIDRVDDGNLTFEEFIETLKDIKKWWDELSSTSKVIIAITSVLAIVGAFIGAIIAAGVIIKGFIAGFIAIKSTVIAVGVALLGIPLWIAVVIGAVLGLIATWVLWKTGVLDAIYDLGFRFGTWLQELGEKVGTWISGLGEKVGTWISGLGEKVGTWISGLGARLGTWLVGLGARFGTWLVELYTNFRIKFWEIKEYLKGKLSDMLTVFGKWVIDIIGEKNVGKLKVAFKTIGDVWEGIKTKIVDAFTTIKEKVNGILVLMNKVVDAYNKIPLVPKMPKFPTFSTESRDTGIDPSSAFGGSDQDTGGLFDSPLNKQVEGIYDNIPILERALESTTNAQNDELMIQKQNAYLAGLDLTQAEIDGVLSMNPALFTTFSDSGEGALTNFTNQIDKIPASTQMAFVESATAAGMGAAEINRIINDNLISEYHVQIIAKYKGWDSSTTFTKSAADQGHGSSIDPSSMPGGGDWSHQFGGPINETGLHFLHKGEYVVPKTGSLIGDKSSAGNTYNISTNVNVAPGTSTNMANDISRQVSKAIADEIKRISKV